MEYKKTYGTAPKGLSINYVTTGNQEPVVIYGWSPMSITIKPTGTSRVEYTQSSSDLVTLGTAIWSTWPKGDVTEESSDIVLYPITAIRVAITSSECSIYLLGDE